MAQFKNLSQLARAYKDGKLARKNKLVFEGATATVRAVPTDKKTKKPVVGAPAEIVFQASADQVRTEALKLAGVPIG